MTFNCYCKRNLLLRKQIFTKLFRWMVAETCSHTGTKRRQNHIKQFWNQFQPMKIDQFNLWRFGTNHNGDSTFQFSTWVMGVCCWPWTKMRAVSSQVSVRTFCDGQSLLQLQRNNFPSHFAHSFRLAISGWTFPYRRHIHPVCNIQIYPQNRCTVQAQRAATTQTSWQLSGNPAPRQSPTSTHHPKSFDIECTFIFEMSSHHAHNV